MKVVKIIVAILVLTWTASSMASSPKADMLSVPYAVKYSEDGTECLILAFEEQEIYLYFITGYGLNAKTKVEILDNSGFILPVNVEPITIGKFSGRGFRVIYDALSAWMFSDLFSGATTQIVVFQQEGKGHIEVVFNVAGLPQHLASRREFDEYADLIQCVISMGKYGNQ